jgi:hypothetical protein
VSEESFDWNLDLEGALDLDFPGWQPEPGDKVMGTVLFVTMSEEGTWGSYPIIGIATSDGGVSVHCFHSVLRKATSSVEVGDLVGIKYKGERRGANQTYADYNVIVKHQGGAMTGGPVSAALPSFAAGTAPEGLPEGAAAPPEGERVTEGIAGWDTADDAPASFQQVAAINKMLSDQGFGAHDWEKEPMTVAEAGDFIRELQAGPA